MADPHPNTRLEAFCDGVFAIALTLLIIDIKIPAPEGIGTARELWLALMRLGPWIFAFVLSLAIILITWVNHRFLFNGEQVIGFVPLRERLPVADGGVHAVSNGVARRIPPDRPCRSCGRHLNSVTTVQALAWILVSGAALRNKLTKDEKSTSHMRDSHRNGYFAVVVYALLALIAL